MPGIRMSVTMMSKVCASIAARALVRARRKRHLPFRAHRTETAL